jgi:hypothetical protein
MRRFSRAALVASLLVLASSGLHAQRAASHSGVWFGGGVGVGSTRLSCTVCRTGRDGGTSGYLRVGATVTPQLLIGGEVLGWYHADGNLSFLLGSVQAVLFLYPMPRSGLYIKTGFGLAQYSAKDPTNKITSQALAAQVGVGYELAFTKSMSVVPYANFLGTTGADVRFNDTVSGLGAKTSLIQVGVGLTLH